MQPVTVCLVAYIAGMLVGSYLDPGASLFYFYLFLPIPVAAVLLLRCRRGVALLFLLVAFLLLGVLRLPQQVSPPTEETAVHQFCGPDPVVIEGSVLRVDSRGPGRSSVDIDVSRLTSRGIALVVSGRVRVYLDASRPELQAGERVRFRSRLRRPRLFGVPGEFDLPRHLAYAGIWTTAFLADADDLAVLAGPPSGILWHLDRWRRQARNLIQEHLPAELAPLVRSLALGERGAVSREQRAQLAEGGIAHLFAISGLHLGLLAWFGYQALLFFYRRSTVLLLWQPPQRVLPLILLPLLFCYLLLTGDALSTRRAFAVCCCAGTLLLWKRNVAPLQVLTGVALWFLLLEPLALWQVSFQLSFVGVAGILCWQRYWRLEAWHWSPRLVKKLLQIMLVTLAATLATAPLVISTFHLFAPAGLLSNLLAIPLVTLFAVPAGLAGVVLAPVLPVLAGPMFFLCGKVLQLTIAVTVWFSGLPGLGSHAVYLTVGQLLFLAAGIALLFFPWQRFLWPVVLLLLLTVGFLFTNPADRNDIRLTVFSVGQGEALLLTLDGSVHILIDGGGLYGDRFDVGERLLAPALGYLGIKHLDAILLTHDHPDHSKGLHSLLEKFPVDVFWSGVAAESLSPALQERLARRQVPLVRFMPGWTEVELADDRSLFLFVPDLEDGKKNDLSVALYVKQGDDGLLLTGDLEEAGAADLLNAGLPGAVTLLKLPHHGSRHSGSNRLAEELLPEKAVVSVGYHNHYRFPAEPLVADLLRAGVDFHRTDWEGTLRFTSNGQGWRVERWSNGLFR